MTQPMRKADHYLNLTSLCMTAAFVVSGIVSFVFFSMYALYYDGVPTTRLSHSFLGSAFAAVEQQRLGVYALALLINAVWFYRASKLALERSGRMGPISAIWGVAYFFIPFVNLWTPFLATRQLWNLSVRQDGPVDAAAPAMFWFWWLAWIAALALDQASAQLTDALDWDAAFRTYLSYVNLGAFFEVSAGVLFFVIQRSVVRSLESAR